MWAAGRPKRRAEMDEYSRVPDLEGNCLSQDSGRESKQIAITKSRASINEVHRHPDGDYRFLRRQIPSNCGATGRLGRRPQQLSATVRMPSRLLNARSPRTP